MSRVLVGELIEKYETLIALRHAREERIREGLNAFPDHERPARRRTMRALAARFPGSLRELDSTELDELRTRLAQLRSTHQGAELLPWMKACALFHEGARVVLAARKNAAKPAPRSASGRLFDEVWNRVARKLGVSSEEAKRLVYPNARRHDASSVIQPFT